MKWRTLHLGRRIWDGGKRQILTIFIFEGLGVALVITQSYDGDGRRVKRVQQPNLSYEVRSSVLGGRVVTELNAQGGKAVTSIYANGGVLAKQHQNGQVTWVHEAPDGSGEWGTSSSGTGRAVELDPLGDDVGMDNPYLEGGDGLGGYPAHGDPTDMSAGCALNNQPLAYPNHPLSP